MGALSEVSTLFALAMGVAWASGINLYAAILVLGLLGYSGQVDLPGSLVVLQHPFVIGAAGFMYFVEFFADKFPGVDSVWDTLHTFVRIPAGAALAASVFGDVDPAIALGIALLGGGLASGTHLTKMGSRLFVNTSPEPFSNVGVSILEDVSVIGVLFLALYHPWLFFGFLVLFILFLFWIMPLLWRGLRHLCFTLKKFTTRSKADTLMQ